MQMKIIRYHIKIIGIVQGVGFRPFVYNLANSLALNGCVSNISDGVIIEIEGVQKSLEVFLSSLKTQPPPLSKIKEINFTVEEPVGYAGFTILQSIKGEEKDAYFSPDISICHDCARELYDKKDQRYLYPFINCTNCGPRFTITKGVPYDRINTTMERFQMCDMCIGEYADPNNRRYHAQPISCFNCGPELSLTDNKGNRIFNGNEIGSVRNLLLDGRIIAMKGIGGYHLVCDAKNEKALRKLRRRKLRDEKPFALMVRDTSVAAKYCKVDESEKKLLESFQKPIVLLKKRSTDGLPDIIATGNPCLGIMLPYTPMHMLLFKDVSESKGENKLEVLVMTSGNISNEPICFKDEDALDNLSDIADYFLINNREIHIRTDDSVTRSFLGKEYIIRRSRGYVPDPITFGLSIFNHLKERHTSNLPSVLACGGELKSTFCISRGDEFFISHHIGDLENTETMRSFEEGIKHFKQIFHINYEIIAYDMHPEYLATKYALEAGIAKLMPVQHHHAHIASCAAENNLNGDIIGVAFDGTGYGEDGHLWGGEFFSGNYTNYKREGHLKYVAMPGGEKAIREPWRMALSYLYSYSSDEGLDLSSDLIFGTKLEEFDFLREVDSEKTSMIIQMLEKKINSPLTSSIGRLFDAVSALIGVRSTISYEGQAAIDLEHIADKECIEQYGYNLSAKNEGFIVCVKSIFEGIIKDILIGTPKGIISAKFHETVASIILDGCSVIRDKTALARVALSGGVFQNLTLLEKSLTKLKKGGFEVFIHSKVPTNDGGISFGQAVIAVSKWTNGERI